MIDRSIVRSIEIEPMKIGIDRKSYFAKTGDRRPIEDRIFPDRTITSADGIINICIWVMLCELNMSICIAHLDSIAISLGLVGTNGGLTFVDSLLPDTLFCIPCKHNLSWVGCRNNSN